MLATSIVLPPLAVYQRVRGELRARGLAAPRTRARAVLFDRDGTLVRDEPYNADPARVELLPDVTRSLARLRREGVRLAMVSNQSGIARGLIGMDAARAVFRRVEDLAGEFDAVAFCPHDDNDGCRCRKPLPGLIHDAAATLGVKTSECVVVGDIATDVAAALAAGARAVLVPQPSTAACDVETARNLPSAQVAVASDLSSAVDLVLSGGPR
jgi:histidinol-phosphate phosphatase family protein